MAIVLRLCHKVAPPIAYLKMKGAEWDYKVADW